MGHQTIFDLLSKDNLTLSQIIGTIWILAEILSRFEHLRSLAFYNDHIILILCSLILLVCGLSCSLQLRLYCTHFMSSKNGFYRRQSW
jgi:hypothetical protein